MVDMALIQQCADPGLQPAIVEEFIERAGSKDPLTVTVRSGNRVILVPKPASAGEALELIRQHVGRNVVRVGITQYPAGLGVIEAGELEPDLVDPCENLRMGTALFARVYRIVTNWYGNPTGKAVLPIVFDNAIIAWQTGYFEGTAVFRAEDPGNMERTAPTSPRMAEIGAHGDHEVDADKTGYATEAEPSDPNSADMRIDLSGIGGRGE